MREKASTAEAAWSSKIVSGASWLSAGYVGELGLRLISSLLLTRLLAPEAFGQMTTAMTFLTVITMLTDVGLRTIAITSPNADDPDFLHTLWTFQLVRGCLLAMTLCLLALAWRQFQSSGFLAGGNAFSEAILPELVMALSISSAISGLQNTGEFILARQAEQKPLVAVDLATKFLNTIFTVGIVAATRSVWGLVYATLLSCAVRSLLSHTVLRVPRMRLCWRREYLKEIVIHGRWIAAHSWVTGIGGVADKIIIGLFFDAKTLGLYSLAFSIFDAFFQLVDRSYQQLGLPTLRRIIDGPVDKIRSTLTKFTIPAEIYGLSIGITISIFGRTLVEGLYDPRYSAAGSIVSALAIFLLLYPFGTVGNAIVARRQFKRAASLNAIRVSSLYIFLLIGAASGRIELVALAFACQRGIEFVFIYKYLIGQNMIDPRIVAVKAAIALPIVGIIAIQVIGR